MSNKMDSTPSRTVGQENSPDKFQNVTSMEHMASLVNSLLHLLGPQRPAIIPGALYTRTQVEANLNISDTTMTLWLDNGLKRYRPATRSDLIMGDDVIEFVTTNADLKRPATFKAKIEQRKKGRTK